jgi:hypothetical protein
MNAQAHRGGLTFDWPFRGKISLLLPGYLGVSVLVHALAFYIFQVVYPPTVSIAPPPAVVSLLTPSTPENQALLAWVASEDPAAVAKPPEALPEGLFDTRYQPSFAHVQTLPKPTARESARVSFPPPRDVIDLVNGALEAPATPAPAAPSRPTEMRISGALANRKIESTRGVHLDAKSAAELQAARFLIGVSSSGEVRYAFLQQTSGDKKIDSQAEAHLVGMRFVQAGSDGIAWGFATFFWGDDAAPDNNGQAPKPK